MKNNNLNNDNKSKLENKGLNNAENLNLKKENSNVERILEASSKLKIEGNKSKEDAWALLSKRLEEPAEKNKSFNISRFVKVSVSLAASIVLVIGLYFVLNNDISTVITAKGEHRKVNLPDGSELILNADSKLEYDEGNWDENRNIKLTGEAFFKVTKGSKFTVNTQKGKVEVLGTSFNIYSRLNILEVKCFSGKVRVSDKKGTQNKVITKGKAVKIAEGTNFESFEFKEEENKSRWINGKFLFEREPVNNVFLEIERQYNVSIQYSNKVEHIYTGFFDTENLEQALKNVCRAMGLSYKKDGNKVIITQN